MANVQSKKKQSGACLLLLGALASMIAVLPQLPGGAESVSIYLTLAHTLVLIIGAFVVTKHRVSAFTLIAGLGLTYFGIGTALTVIGNFDADANTQASLLSVGFILILPFYLAILVSTCRRSLQSSASSRDRLIAVVSFYLTLGIFFAMSQTLLWHRDHAAFNFASTFEPATFDRFNDFIHYSFATITMLGQSDITPASLITKSLTIIEAFTGVISVVVIITRLVMTHQPRTTKSTNDE